MVEESKRGSGLAIVFYLLSIVIFIAGLSMGLELASGRDVDYKAVFSWQIAWITWVSTIFTGMFFIGLGRIIELLTDIKNK